MPATPSLHPAPPGSLAAALPVLRRLARRRPRAAAACELCASALADSHPHLIAFADRRIVCCCPACALLFEGDDRRSFRRIPRDVRALQGWDISDVDWASLALPVNLAFFFYNSTAGRVAALYPSPAGVTEAEIEADAFTTLTAADRRLQALLPDVEALLVNRLKPPYASYIVPIDRCYALAGLVRTHWRGFSGGDELWAQVAAFFTALAAEAEHGSPHA